MRLLMFLSVGWAIAVFGVASAQEGTPPDKPIEVMVLGSYHFAGSKSDIINPEIGSVLTPERQKELQALADALSTFQPNIVVVERETEAPDYEDPIYLDYDKNMLATVANERVQIGYRLAKRAGVSRVLGINERTTEGEPDYFPFGTLVDHAEATEQAAKLEQLIQSAKLNIEEETARLQALTIPEALYEVNTGLISSPEVYYRMMELDTGEVQPAAELQAYWFMRNAKIFSKLVDVTEQGDRVFIVYGAGHKFWLEHLVEQMPGFELVSPEPFLQAATKALQ
ncbi:MAG: DUF5694 domain-containing protein [Pseudomonadota bacterium]